jgi:uncharacterized repeat protein (TIGR01451 family)
MILKTAILPCFPARRTRLFRFIVVVLVLAFAGLAGSPAQAESVTESAPYGFTHTGAVSSGLISLLGFYTNTVDTAAAPILLPKFNPVLGKLNKVTIGVTASTSTFSIVPTGLLSLLGGQSAKRNLAYSVTGGASTGGNASEAVTSGATLLTLLSIGSAEIGGATAPGNTTFTAASDMAGFTGPGSVSIAVSAQNTLEVFTLLSLLEGAGMSGSGAYAGVVTVTYDYTLWQDSELLSLTQTVDNATGLPGSLLVYTITFTNVGPGPLTDISVDNQTPVFTSFQSADVMSFPATLTSTEVIAPAVGATGAIRWNFSGTLEPNASGKVRVTVQIDE